jgi:hypothetical protein
MVVLKSIILAAAAFVPFAAAANTTVGRLATDHLPSVHSFSLAHHRWRWRSTKIQSGHCYRRSWRRCHLPMGWSVCLSIFRCYNQLAQLAFSPGNHSVTQSSFAAPCTPLTGGFDSGLIFTPAGVTGFAEWNLTITNASART